MCLANIGGCRRGRCPIDRTDGFLRNYRLQQDIESFTSKCKNFGCNQCLFKWDIQNHLNECEYDSTICPLCNKRNSVRMIINLIF